MTKSEKFFSFKTTSGALRLLVLFVVLIVLFSVVAQLLTTNGYKIEVSDIVIN